MLDLCIEQTTFCTYQHRNETTNTNTSIMGLDSNRIYLSIFRRVERNLEFALTGLFKQLLPKATGGSLPIFPSD